MSHEAGEPTETNESRRALRHARIIEAARERGLLPARKDQNIGFRAPAALVEAAKRSTGITENTELLTFALAVLAVEDDFGERLLARKGQVPKGIFGES